MRAFLHSIATGASSILSLMPSFRVRSFKGSELEAIGADFSKVGGDIHFAFGQYALDAKKGAGLKAPNGREEKAEQLEFIETRG
jgi:hypothetical protein